jgi:hypothetical protein
MQLFTLLLRIQNQLRIFHWQTESFSQHKAFGKAYEELDGLIDQFVEVYMGKYGRSKAKITYNLELQNFEEQYLLVIDTYIDDLISLNNELDPVVDSDLLNIRDEMLGLFNRLKYLLTLK